jgi:TRAP-type uncharacterized transport system substrate-binding protein
MPAPKLVSMKGPRALFILLSLVALAVVIARLDLRPNLGHVHVRLLSGPREGNYHVVADGVAAAAAKKRGTIENVDSEGSMENLQRLAAAAGNCDVQAALVQAGLPFPEQPRLELYARLPRSESIFLLGKRGDALVDFRQLAHLRIGIGPEGSGTARLVRQVFEAHELAGLGVVLSNHPLAEQVELAQKGDLDLAVFVMDEDAAFIVSAVRDRGLEIVGLPHADVVARRFRYLRHGRIGAGQYDAVRMIPAVDKEVLRVDTLLVGNGCAKRSQVMGLMTAFTDVFPDLLRHEHETPNATGLELAPAARNFLDAGGPETLDQYLPRVSDLMPPTNWVHLVMAVSVLFNLMGVGNRFLLWRIDAARVRAEREIELCFGPATTLGDIARVEPRGDLLRPAVRAEVERVLAELEALAARSRRQSLSVLVPMGAEMAYRYQEGLIHDTLSVLRAFRERWLAATARAAA